MKQAFTLIELLVVVLIIGILAAVALPQYQVAVIKTRTMAALPLLRSIANAEKVYHLANGQYTLNFDDLDIEMPGGYTDKTGRFITYPNVTYSLKADWYSVSAYPANCPRLEIYFDKASIEEDILDKVICWPLGNATYEKVCKSLSGLSEPNVNGEAYSF